MIKMTALKKMSQKARVMCISANSLVLVQTFRERLSEEISFSKIKNETALVFSRVLPKRMRERVAPDSGLLDKTLDSG
jgi:hypothetical protein